MERRQRQRRLATYMIVALLVSLIGRISSLSVTVNDEECISEYVIYEGDTVSGNFVVVDHDIFWGSDHPGIDFTVTSPAGNVVHTLTGTSGDKFEFKAPRSGMYKFCFRNPYSTPETVSFYIHVGHIPNEHNLAKDEHLDPINVKIAELREALESVTAEQKYLKARDTRHRHIATGLANNVSLSYKKPRLRSSLQPKGMARTTSNCVTHNSPLSAKTETNESTRKRLLGYTIGEYVLLAAASALQVAYIRSLFSKSVAYNRV
ncbi:hypothetical protein Patl1_25288 [Pistacia atlantica]|uniref:Uncharacterized protein n=1 Tax=Pistacia atlantica TaxID=434234 RepID=A0ACC1B4S9_9ROSI|nr:hypothetical protein Patl1_25288 [Pistacia atlantica]